MNSYLITLLVTEEQEQAIKLLFEHKRWTVFKTCTRQVTREEFTFITKMPMLTFGGNHLNKSKGQEYSSLDSTGTMSGSAEYSSLSNVVQEDPQSINSTNYTSKSFSLLDNIHIAQFPENQATKTVSIPSSSAPILKHSVLSEDIQVESSVTKSSDTTNLQNRKISSESAVCLSSDNIVIQKVDTQMNKMMGKVVKQDDEKVIKDLEQSNDQQQNSNRVDLSKLLTSISQILQAHLQKENMTNSVDEVQRQVYEAINTELVRHDYIDATDQQAFNVANQNKTLQRGITLTSSAISENGDNSSTEIKTLNKDKQNTSKDKLKADFMNINSYCKALNCNSQMKLDKLQISIVRNQEKSDNSSHLIKGRPKSKRIETITRLDSDDNHDASDNNEEEDDVSNDKKANSDTIAEDFDDSCSHTSEANTEATESQPKINSVKMDKGKVVYRKRKYKWSTNRNVRMHNCHRKCSAIPPDLDSKDYSKTEKGFFCRECMFIFRTDKQFQLHKDLKSGQCSPDCIYCDKDNLRDVYQCTKCPKCFKTEDVLEKHMEKHLTNPRTHLCYVCDDSFQTAFELKTHTKLAHKEEVEVFHLCDLCGAKFNERKVLNAHRKYVHTDERPEQCPSCDKKFKTKSQLKNHQVKHKKVDEMNLSCEICGKMFLRVATLKDHVRRHKKEYTIFCDICGKGFYKKYGLGEHMRIHTGVKPYDCKWCNYKCALRCNLLKHMKTHFQKKL